MAPDRRPYKEGVTTDRRHAGAVLRARREAAGLSLVALAERSGIARRTLQRYESGAYCPRVVDVLPLALALDLDDERARRFAAEICGVSSATT